MWIESVLKMTTNVRQMENAVQVIMNLHYLIEVDVSNPSRVLKYVKMSDPSVQTLTTFLAEMRATAQGRSRPTVPV